MKKHVRKNQESENAWAPIARSSVWISFGIQIACPAVLAASFRKPLD
jgi:hypothetical protein